MEKDLAKKQRYMMVPKGSSHWIIRKRVPKDLAGVLGSGFIQETLGTSDLTIANQR